MPSDRKTGHNRRHLCAFLLIAENGHIAPEPKTLGLFLIIILTMYSIYNRLSAVNKGENRMKKLWYSLAWGLLCTTAAATAQENAGSFPKPAVEKTLEEPTADFPRPLQPAQQTEEDNESFIVLPEEVLQAEESDEDNELKATSLIGDDTAEETPAEFPKPRDPVLPQPQDSNTAPSENAAVPETFSDIKQPAAVPAPAEAPDHETVPAAEPTEPQTPKEELKAPVPAPLAQSEASTKNSETSPAQAKPKDEVSSHSEGNQTSASAPQENLPEPKEPAAAVSAEEKTAPTEPLQKESAEEKTVAEETPPAETNDKEADTDDGDETSSLQDAIHAQIPAGPYALSKDAPIPAKLLGDSGFAPTLLNKTIEISPEQRVKMLMKKKYDEMDANHDGMVSEEEFVTYKTEEARKIAKEIFKRVDRNSNGLLSEYEYGILMNKMIENYIKQPKVPQQ